MWCFVVWKISTAVSEDPAASICGREEFCWNNCACRSYCVVSHPRRWYSSYSLLWELWISQPQISHFQEGSFIILVLTVKSNILKLYYTIFEKWLNQIHFYIKFVPYAMVEFWARLASGGFGGKYMHLQCSSVSTGIITLKWLHSETTVPFMLNILLFFYTQAHVMYMCVWNRDELEFSLKPATLKHHDTEVLALGMCPHLTADNNLLSTGHNMSNILNKTCFHSPRMLQHFINFILFLWYEALYSQGSVHRSHKIYHTVPQRKHTVSITKTPSIHAVCSENHTNLAHILG
jgi:hypothetical protein